MDINLYFLCIAKIALLVQYFLWYFYFLICLSLPHFLRKISSFPSYCLDFWNKGCLLYSRTWIILHRGTIPHVSDFPPSLSLRKMILKDKNWLFSKLWRGFDDTVVLHIFWECFTWSIFSWRTRKIMWISKLVARGNHMAPIQNTLQFHTYSILVIPKLTLMVFSQRCCTDPSVWHSGCQETHLPVIKGGREWMGSVSSICTMNPITDSPLYVSLQ